MSWKILERNQTEENYYLQLYPRSSRSQKDRFNERRIFYSRYMVCDDKIQEIQHELILMIVQAHALFSSNMNIQYIKILEKWTIKYICGVIYNEIYKDKSCSCLCSSVQRPTIHCISQRFLSSNNRICALLLLWNLGTLLALQWFKIHILVWKRKISFFLGMHSTE